VKYHNWFFFWSNEKICWFDKFKIIDIGLRATNGFSIFVGFWLKGNKAMELTE
jgi:hypothetical protein